MKRNLGRRLEILLPIRNPALRQRLVRILSPKFTNWMLDQFRQAA